MVPGLDGNNIYFCTLVSQPTKFYIYMLVAPIRTRAKSTRLVAYAVLQNSILYFPDLEPVNYCQKNPEPMAIFITVTLTIIPTKSAINAAAKTNLVFLILTELE